MNTSVTARRRLIVAITGATGVLYGVRLLQALRATPNVESHLLISDAGVLNLHQELDLKRKDVEALANFVHSVRDVGASIASGSFTSDGMIVAPCSMKTLAAIATGLSDNLITRAADVMLKERRRLVLMVRESPLNLAHLRNMIAVTEMGGIVFPPLPGFYHRPRNIVEMVDHTIGRVLDLYAIEHQLGPRWSGVVAKEPPAPAGRPATTSRAPSPPSPVDTPAPSGVAEAPPTAIKAPPVIPESDVRTESNEKLPVLAQTESSDEKLPALG